MLLGHPKAAGSIPVPDTNLCERFCYKSDDEVFGMDRGPIPHATCNRRVLVHVAPDHDPMCSSRKCPTCGRSDSRMGALFECGCGLDIDSNVSSSIDPLQTAVSKRLEVAGGLRFDPGAFRHDAMMILYEPAMAARSEPNGTSCDCGVT